jgi:hypothetical protein
MLRSKDPSIDTSLAPSKIAIVLEQSEQLKGIIQAAIDAEPPVSEELKESLVNWQKIIVQNEMHHIVPEWLDGPEVPNVELHVPRILHNFGVGPSDPGFHQVLNGVLMSEPLNFAPANDRASTGPRINDFYSVQQWLTTNPVNRSRLHAALVRAYSNWEGSKAPGLLTIIVATLSDSFKQLEAVKT